MFCPGSTPLTCYSCTFLQGHYTPLQMLKLSKFLTDARTVFPLPSAMLRLFLLLNPNSRLTFSVNPSSIACPWPFHLLPWCGWLDVKNRLSSTFSFVCVCVCVHTFVCLICIVSAPGSPESGRDKCPLLVLLWQHVFVVVGFCCCFWRMYIYVWFFMCK